MANRGRNEGRERLWRDVLARFHKSGLTVRAFCRREQLSEPSFYAWRRTIQVRDGGRRAVRERSKTGPRTPPAFLPLVVERDWLPPPSAGITLELRGGRTLRLPESISVERLAALVQALEPREEHP